MVIRIKFKSVNDETFVMLFSGKNWQDDVRKFIEKWVHIDEGKLDQKINGIEKVDVSQDPLLTLGLKWCNESAFDMFMKSRQKGGSKQLEYKDVEFIDSPDSEMQTKNIYSLYLESLHKQLTSK